MKDFDYEKLMMEVRKFQKKMQKQFNDDLRQLNISTTHIGVIMLLSKKEEGYSMTELSKMTCVDNALMTRNIKELEKIEYIYRNRESDLQRKYHICLTQKGKEISYKLKEIMHKKQEEFLNCFEKEEQEVLERAYKILAKKFINKIEKEEKEC